MFYSSDTVLRTVRRTKLLKNVLTRERKKEVDDGSYDASGPLYSLDFGPLYSFDLTHQLEHTDAEINREEIVS